MPHEIVIEFKPLPGLTAFVHRIRNFGEALHHLCAEYHGAALPLEQVDQATDRLCVQAGPKRHIRRLIAAIEALLDDHHLSDCARIVEHSRDDDS